MTPVWAVANRRRMRPPARHRTSQSTKSQWKRQAVAMTCHWPACPAVAYVLDLEAIAAGGDHCQPPQPAHCPVLWHWSRGDM